MVTTHVVRLKLFRLKAEGVEEHDCRTLAEYLLLAPNMASKCDFS